ncbi:MAG: putative PEP-binding protein, partial [Pirellulaceae bacterium]
ELLQAKMVLADAMEDLDERGVAFNRRLPVGIMVEVPSAVITLDKFLPEIDFISVGTNDLIQYALAVDRCNSQISDAYQAGDPAVLRLLETTLRTARAGQVPASICGQMSGEVTYTMLLLGLGARVLSVPPSAIPEIKKVCRSVTMVHCEEVAQRALTLDSAQEVDRYLREVVRKVVPELVAA